MQLAVIEYARHVCGLIHANSTEVEPDCPQPVIDVLPEQKKLEGLGGNMRLGGHDIVLTPDTVVSRLFDDAERIRLRFRHRYEVNPDYIETLEKSGLVFAGKSPQFPIMHVLELPAERHPFFLATQAHPELTSRPLSPQPMFVGLVRAALVCSGVPVNRGCPSDGLEATSCSARAKTCGSNRGSGSSGPCDSVDTAATSA
jgi:CTP synthase